MNPNETPLLANAADGGSPFAILQHDGFLVPFGTYPHKQGLQLFDKTAAEEIVAAHNSTFSKLTRFVTGGSSYPIYIGHPDLPGSKDADKRAYGWIENMRVTEEGLHLSAKWSDAGRDLVENAHFKFYSPLWWTKKVKGGIRPISLKSMGLTNDPNIPVPALANESQPTNTDEMNPQQLTALGLEEGATPEEVLAKITALKDAAADKDAAENKATEADTAKAEYQTKATDAETAKAEAEEKKVEAENALATANEKIIVLENHLDIAAGNAVAAAVQAGRITPADADAKKSELLAANDLATALEELVKLPVVMKTTSATGDLGTAKSRLVIAANDESAAAKAERATLVDNEFQNTNPDMSLGERKRIAWNRARAKNPDAFGSKPKDSSGSAA